MIRLLALLIATLALLPCVARAEPLIPASQIITPDEIRPGMKGYGRTVFQGTRVESFPVNVVGVLKNIDFGGDMILVEVLGGPVIKREFGIAAGMSGSPIYINGRLAGALAYGWAFARAPIAGVTPIRQMLEAYQPGSAPPSGQRTGSLRPAAPLQIAGRTFTHAEVRDFNDSSQPAPNALVLKPVATPLFVSGMSRRAVEHLNRTLGRHGIVAFAGGGGGQPNTTERPRLEPGQAVGVQLISGDLDVSAVGTVTWVQGDKVLAFGHPMMGLGTVSLPMTTAYVHGILASLESSFKLASPIEVVGRLSQDRNWTIGGELGQTAPTITGRFQLQDQGRGVRRDYRIRVARQKELASPLLFSALTAALDSLGPPPEHTAHLKVALKPEGLPEFVRENVFTTATGEPTSFFESLFDNPFAGQPLGDILEALSTLENNRFGTVLLESASVEMAVTPKVESAVLERVLLDRRTARPGERVKLTAVLQPKGEPKETRTVEITLPKDLPPGNVYIGVAGGRSAAMMGQRLGLTKPKARTLAQLLEQLSTRERNNELIVETLLPTVGLAVAGEELAALPRPVLEALMLAQPTDGRLLRGHARQSVTLPWSTSGQSFASLIVEGGEAEKGGSSAAMMPGYGGMGMLGSFFEALFRQGSPDQFVGPEDGSDEGMGEAVLRRLATGNVPPPRLPAPKMPSWDELDALLDQPADKGGPSAGRGLARGARAFVENKATQFQKGTLEGIALTSRDRLVLAPRVERLATFPERVPWSLAKTVGGAWRVGAWMDAAYGEATSVTPATAWAGSAALHPVVAAGGHLYGVLLPQGQLLQLDGDKPVVRAELGESLVWTMTSDGKDGLILGTGPRGRLVHWTPAEGAKTVFTAPDRHIIALARATDGAVTFATSPRGKVYHWTPGGTIEPIYETSGATVQSLALAADGDVLLGLSPKAGVLRLKPNGVATQVYTGSDRHVMALAVAPDGSVYVGTASRGRILRIAPDQTVTQLLDIGSGAVLSLTLDGGELIATTAAPNQVLRLRLAETATGTYTSSVFDAGAPARWGVIRWDAEGSVNLQTRSGNTAAPDDSWSGWSAAYTTPAGAPIASPRGRFLQYRATLGAGAQPPVLHSVRAFAQSINRPPSLTLTSPSRGDLWSGTKLIEWTATDPDGDKLTAEVSLSTDGGKTWKPLPQPKEQPEESADESAVPGSEAAPGETTEPSTTDPGTTGAGAETTTAGDAGAAPTPPPSSDRSWDTKSVPDGRYRLKIVVTDRNANPFSPEEVTAISEPFVVVNTAPRVAAHAATAPAPKTLIVTSRWAPVASAEYRVDGGPWVAAAAEDGVFDSPTERLVLDATRLPHGAHRLEVRVRDTQGNERTEARPYGQTAAPPIRTAPPAAPRTPAARPTTSARPGTRRPLETRPPRRRR